MSYRIITPGSLCCFWNHIDQELICIISVTRLEWWNEKRTCKKSLTLQSSKAAQHQWLNKNIFCSFSQLWRHYIQILPLPMNWRARTGNTNLWFHSFLSYLHSLLTWLLSHKVQLLTVLQCLNRIRKLQFGLKMSLSTKTINILKTRSRKPEQLAILPLNGTF